jgi:3D (Asp-Asp-Asp) domain-containing protein
VYLRNPRVAPGLFAACLCAVFLSACASRRPAPAPGPAPPRARELEVTATAFNSTEAQTDASPSTTAFGLRLCPGMKVVAVSRDLEALGLTSGVRIRIEGLDGDWQVGDRMDERWTRKIDVYFGDDVEAAKRFGKRRVTIRW